MKLVQNIFTTALTLSIAGIAHAGVAPLEAAKLGKSLTMLGAEKAANADGTIPEYTGGLPINTAPPGYKPGDTQRPDPFAEDKPYLVIDSKNMAEHKDQLTVSVQELMKRYPDFRIDVYPTRRSATIPERYLATTVENATRAKSTEGGLAVENALPGIPFPIPQTGAEVMWNHLLSTTMQQATEIKFDSWSVDASGEAVLATTGVSFSQYPLSDAKRVNEPVLGTDEFSLYKLYYTAPTRRVGEAVMVFDSVNPIEEPRRSWQYLPGQRRVKMAPDICCDTPNPATLGASTYDDAFLFNGTMERFDWKLIGKKEVYVPYNSYKLLNEKDPEKILLKDFIDPDSMRWELHRVWVIEADLKPGKRHIYHKRTFYVDEDSWTAVASDQYDARGELYRGGFSFIAPSWDVQAASTGSYMAYDFIGGVYTITGLYGPYWGVKYIEDLSSTQWSPKALAAGGVR
jgi:hypothetical protein